MARDNGFKALCVGGPLDGRVAISSDEVMTVHDNTGKGFSYKRLVIRYSTSADCYFWIPVGQTQGWTMQKLMDVYRRHRFGKEVVPIRVTKGHTTLGAWR